MASDVRRVVRASARVLLALFALWVIVAILISVSVIFAYIAAVLGIVLAVAAVIAAMAWLRERSPR